MKENAAVYTALREHILTKEEQIANEVIYMYVTYFALLAVGSIWNQWVSLVCFIDLIAFQAMINGDQWSITKASLYIEVFFEEPCGDIHWESFQHYSKFSEMYTRKMGKTAGWYFRKRGASILSVVSFLFILLSAWPGLNGSVCEISLETIIRVSLSLILCVTTIRVNQQYFPLRGFKNNNEFEVIMKDFYNECYHKDKTGANKPLS